MTKVYSNDLIGKRESVVDELLLLNPHQTPMLNLIGFGPAVTNVEHTWFEDSFFAAYTTASAAATAAATSLTVLNTEPFRPNAIVKAGEEMMLVTAVDAVAKTVTVVRGYAGTTAAAVTSGERVEFLFVEGQEGNNARDARYKARKRVSNLTQIFDESVEVSGTAMAVAQWGINSLYETEKQKRQLELALQLEKAVINGLYYENGVVRQMKGARNFIQTNVLDAAAAAVDDKMINGQFQAIYENGGFDQGASYKIVVPAKQKIKISDFGKLDIRLTRQDNGRGQVVDHFISDFGQAEIMLNNNMDAGELFIIDANRLNIRPLSGRDFGHEYMGKQGDYMKGMLLGEYTLEFLQENAHARIKNLG